MFAGFKLSLGEQDLLPLIGKNFSEYETLGEKIFKKNKSDMKKSLDEYFDKNGVLDGSKLQESWFPQIDCDIFLSHSHKDEKIAKVLAGWLYQEFNLKVFIDSCVWSYCLDLQKLIDDLYCRPNPKEQPKLYSYEKVMYSTSHIHMMLSTALTMMIDKCESVFLLNTPNVIKTEDTISKTESPWIYHEIAMTNLVRKRPLSSYRYNIAKEASVEFSEQQKILRIAYEVYTTHLISLDVNDLLDWLSITSENCQNSIVIEHVIMYKDNTLDYLYIKKEIMSGE